MSLARAYDTVPAFPLGQPVDGRDRYGMTPEQAALYRWLINNRPNDRPFIMDFRDIARKTVIGLYHAHLRVQGLVERGWLAVSADENHMQRRYSFVQPIMRFERRR